MINIITKQELLANKNVINPEAYFDANISIGILDERDKHFLQLIDSAKVISPIAIETKYGVTELENISTGCKTILIFNHLMKQGVIADLSINECGNNVIKEIFSLSEEENNSSIRFYVRNASSLMGQELKKFKYCANGNNIGNNIFGYMGSKEST